MASISHNITLNFLKLPLKPYQASVELDASRFTHEIDYAACPICRLLPDAAIE